MVRMSSPSRWVPGSPPLCGPDAVTSVPTITTNPAATTAIAVSGRRTGASSAGGPAPVAARSWSTTAAATSAIDAIRWVATTSGDSPVSTVTPPMAACTRTPAGWTRASRQTARRSRASRRAARTTHTATASTTKVMRRLPNSMNVVHSAVAACGTTDPPSQVGQSGHPNPEPVIRTIPPVTMMAMLAITAASDARARRGMAGLPAVADRLDVGRSRGMAMGGRIRHRHAAPTPLAPRRETARPPASHVPRSTYDASRAGAVGIISILVRGRKGRCEHVGCPRVALLSAARQNPAAGAEDA